MGKMPGRRDWLVWFKGVHVFFPSVKRWSSASLLLLWSSSSFRIRGVKIEALVEMELCKAHYCSWSKSMNPFPHNSKMVTRDRRISTFFITNSYSSSNSKPTDEMIVSVVGGTGFIGKRLVQRLHSDNHRVFVLTRTRSKALSVFPARDYPKVEVAEEPEWRNCIRGSTAVINLAGTSISTRWSSEVKKDIKESRIRTTAKVVDFINGSPKELRPKVFVSATAVGYYGASDTQVFDEGSPPGNDYLAEVCREWEAAALGVDEEVRLALIRIGIVLGKEGGALAKMIPLFMMFAGGPLGSGRQWFSWIHVDDLVDLIYEALINPSYKGVINGTAPNPVRLAEMCDQLGSILGRPSWLPVPEFALQAVLGEGAYVVLQGQKVLPTRAQQLGFPFKFPYVKDALRAIMS